MASLAVGSYADQLRGEFRNEWSSIIYNNPKYLALNAQGAAFEEDWFVSTSRQYPSIPNLEFTPVFENARYIVLHCSNIGDIVTGRTGDTLSLVYEKTTEDEESKLRKPAYGLKNVDLLLEGRDGILYFSNLAANSWVSVLRGPPSSFVQATVFPPTHVDSHCWITENKKKPADPASEVRMAATRLRGGERLRCQQYINVSSAGCCASVTVVPLSVKSASLVSIHRAILNAPLTQAAKLVSECNYTAANQVAVNSYIADSNLTPSLMQNIGTTSGAAEIVKKSIIVTCCSLVHVYFTREMDGGERRSLVLCHKVATDLLSDSVIRSTLKSISSLVTGQLPAFVITYIQQLCAFYFDEDVSNVQLFTQMCDLATEGLHISLENVFGVDSTAPESADAMTFFQLSQILQRPTEDGWPQVSRAYQGRYEFPSAIAAEIDRIAGFIVATGEGRCLPDDKNGTTCTSGRALTEELPLNAATQHPHPVATFYPPKVMLCLYALAKNDVVVKAASAHYTHGSAPTTQTPLAWPASSSCRALLPRRGTDVLVEQVSRVSATFTSVQSLLDELMKKYPAGAAAATKQITVKRYTELILRRSRALKVLPTVTVFTIDGLGNVDVQFSGDCAEQSNLIVVTAPDCILLYSPGAVLPSVLVGINGRSTDPSPKPWDDLLRDALSNGITDEACLLQALQTMREKLCGLVTARPLQFSMIDSKFSAPPVQRGEKKATRPQFNYRACYMLECFSRCPTWNASIAGGDEDRMKTVIDLCGRNNTIYGIHEP
jgi:hypothetical protein